MKTFKFQTVKALMFALISLTFVVDGKGSTTTDAEPRVYLVKTDDSRKVQLVYQAAHQVPVEIKVLDESGHTLYKSIQKNEVNFQKLLSFEELPSGTYFIEVQSEEVSYREAVTFDLQEQELEVNLFPYNESGKVVLTIPGATTAEVEIFDDYSNLVYSGQVTLDPETDSQLFDLRQVRGRSVSFRVSTEEATSVENYSLR